MLIKFDAEESLAAQLKAQYGQKVASKAFHMAALDSLRLADDVRELRRQLDELRETIRVQRRTIEAARSAAAQLLEAAAQGDLLNG